MTAIVVNTLSGAATEYDWAFQSLTAKHAASAAGLHTLGGDTDAGVLIAGEVRSGRPGGQQVQSLGNVFVAVDSPGEGEVIVQGRATVWSYPIAARASGVYAISPGRGIRESYLGFGYRNTAGVAFRLDRIDAEIEQSTTRRK